MLKVEALEEIQEFLMEQKQAMKVSPKYIIYLQLYHLRYIESFERSEEELGFIRYASEYSMNKQFALVTNDSKFIQLFFSTFHMSQSILKNSIIPDENFARLLVVSCLMLVSKLTSSEHIIKLIDILVINQMNLEVAIVLESYILNLVEWRLNLTTPDGFAEELMSVLFSGVKDDEIIRTLLNKFNRVYECVIRDFGIYSKYNQFEWTLVILQHSLISFDFNEKSAMLSEIIARLINSEAESESLADCFDLLIVFLEKFEQDNCFEENEEFNLGEDNTLSISPNVSDCLELEYNRTSHVRLNMNLLAKFDSIVKRDSVQKKCYTNSSNYNTVTKSSDKDNYDSTGSMTVLSLNPNNDNSKQFLPNYEAVENTSYYCAKNLEVEDTPSTKEGAQAIFISNEAIKETLKINESIID